jgi:hypothetical protein
MSENEQYSCAHKGCGKSFDEVKDLVGHEFQDHHPEPVGKPKRMQGTIGPTKRRWK